MGDILEGVLVVKVKFEWIKLYCNIGIIGYIDYGKMIFIVVIFKVLYDKYLELNEELLFD